MSDKAARLAETKPLKPIAGPKKPTSIFDFTVHGIDEETVALSKYSGRVCMCVMPHTTPRQLGRWAAGADRPRACV